MTSKPTPDALDLQKPKPEELKHLNMTRKKSIKDKIEKALSPEISTPKQPNIDIKQFLFDLPSKKSEKIVKKKHSKCLTIKIFIFRSE